MKKEKPLATEMIHTLKTIIILLIIGWVLTIAGFIWYIYQPIEDETYIQDADTQGENSPISQEIGE